MLIRAPKYESERTIYLPDKLVTILSQHVGQHTPDGERSRWLSMRAASRGTTTWSTIDGAQCAPTPARPTDCTTCGTTPPVA